ncbi:AMP-binding protein [Rhodopila sp.]|jgi:long-chain acyl-CoA synthetase|uniref:AMP-binding protein n=1 Tax=Rhodopila sp. TaxID=2480087 RepID=UPI002D01CE45|nr:AMP-binding protein [Rhodopila sp.]HVZ10320.1 AMP-binding protein [Rhodopila sp.]
MSQSTDIEGTMEDTASLPALVAHRAAAAPSKVILRRKARGIWHAVTWMQLAEQVGRIAAGLYRLDIEPGDAVAIIAETRPETVYCDLAAQACGGVSVAIEAGAEADQIAHILRATGCRLIFVEGEEQLDKLLTIRDGCPALSHIVIFDMKGLREFQDPQCVSLADFADRGDRTFDWTAAARTVRTDNPAVILFPADDPTSSGQVLTHRDVLRILGQARDRLAMSAKDERLAVLSMADPTERIWGLYAALDRGCISNYLESADTAVENLQELRPTVLGADAEAWAHLHARAMRSAAGATAVHRLMYNWAIKAGRFNGSASRLADLLVLRSIRRESGLSRLRLAYVGGAPVNPVALDWARSLGIQIERIDDIPPPGEQPERQYDPVMQRAPA